MVRAWLAGLVLCAASAMSQEIKIAQVNTSEINTIIRDKLLADPVNKEVKDKLDKLQVQISLVQTQTSVPAPSSPAQTDRAKMQELSQLHQQRAELERSMELQKKKLLLTTIREIAKEKYVVVLDTDYGDALLYKNAELVDITFDVKERLLTKDP